MSDIRIRSEWLLLAFAAFAVACVPLGADVNTSLGFFAGCLAGAALARLERDS